MKRLCFGWHGREAGFTHRTGFARAIGVPRPAHFTLPELQVMDGGVKNRGYLVIGEATARLFDCDREQSALVNLPLLLEETEPEDLAAAIDRTFDALVLPMAYEIGSGTSCVRLAAMLQALRAPIISLGLGLASDESVNLDEMHPSVGLLLRTLDSKALLFGVRGETTRRWLARQGFQRAIALGCPSLHLYPKSMRRLQIPAAVRGNGPVATGGYLLRDDDRSRWHCRLFEETHSTYILQDEIFSHDTLPNLADLIDDATGEFSRTAMEAAVHARIGVTPPFSRYMIFHSLDAWRLCCAGHRAYVGDRFHGAVVALQVGVPALLFVRDVRARELTEFYRMPTVDLEDASVDSLDDLLAREGIAGALADFQTVWAERHHSFMAALNESGLTFRELRA